jgi:hypothetical protein
LGPPSVDNVSMRRVVAELILAIGLLAGSVAISGWWFQSTTLDPSRTERVASTVLESPEVRTAVGEAIATAVAKETGLDEATMQQTVNDAIRTVPDLSFLSSVVADAHRAAIGEGPSRVQLDQEVLAPLVGAEVAAQAAGVGFTVPEVGVLTRANEGLSNWLQTLAIISGLCVLAAFILHPTRPAVFRRLGWWLLGLSLWQLMITWVIPAVVVPSLTTNPWALLAAKVSVASTSDVIPALAGLAVAGIASLVAAMMWTMAGETRAKEVHAGGQPVVGSAAWSAWAAHNATNAQNRQRPEPTAASQPTKFSGSHDRQRDEGGWKL